MTLLPAFGQPDGPLPMVRLSHALPFGRYRYLDTGVPLKRSAREQGSGSAIADSARRRTSRNFRSLSTARPCTPTSPPLSSAFTSAGEIGRSPSLSFGANPMHCTGCARCACSYGANAWVGPAGTISPLHRDPYHNILSQVASCMYPRYHGTQITQSAQHHCDNIVSQVVGQKRVRLYAHATLAKRAALATVPCKTATRVRGGLDCVAGTGVPLHRCAAQAISITDYPRLQLRPSPIRGKHAKQARSRQSTYPTRIGVLTQYSQSITRPCPLETSPTLLCVGMLRTAKLRCIRQTTRCRRALCGALLLAISACGFHSAAQLPHALRHARTHARTNGHRRWRSPESVLRFASCASDARLACAAAKHEHSRSGRSAGARAISSPFRAGAPKGRPHAL